MQPYLQTTNHTTAVSSLLTLLHHFNPQIKLNKENEFDLWRKTATLPTRASSIYALAIIAHQNNLNPKIIVEKKEYDYPDYRFQRYTKEDIEQANFSSQLYLQKAEQLKIPIEEKSFTLTDIKKFLKQRQPLLLRLNAGPIRNDKSTSQYLLLINFNPETKQFQLIDPAQGTLQIPETTLKESFQTLETKKYRDHHLIVFSPKL